MGRRGIATVACKETQRSQPRCRNASAAPISGRQRGETQVHSFDQEGLFEKLYDRLPREFSHMRELTLSALWRSPEHWELAPERFE